MLLEEIKNIKSDRRDLRSFSFVIGGALIIIGLWGLFKGGSFWQEFMALGGLIIAVGFLFPPILKPFQKIWMTLAVLMGWFMTRFILLVIFYFVFTPIHFIAKLVGKKFLVLSFKSHEQSYWIYRNPEESSKMNLEKQF